MKKTSILLIISCFIGIFTASIYASRIQNLRDEINRSSERVSVLAVARKIRAGEKIMAGDVTTIRVFKEQTPGRAISPENMKLILGRQVIHPIPAHDPILWTDFPEGPRVRHPSEKIPPGYRLIALPADEVHTLSHFIHPGDRVDIVSSTYDVSKNHLVSRLIAQNIQILAVGHRLERGTNEPDFEELPGSVSLLVLPENALAILRASQIGEIHFLAQGFSNIPGEFSNKEPTALSAELSGEKQ